MLSDCYFVVFAGGFPVWQIVSGDFEYFSDVFVLDSGCGACVFCCIQPFG